MYVCVCMIACACAQVNLHRTMLKLRIMAQTLYTGFACACSQAHLMRTSTPYGLHCWNTSRRVRQSTDSDICNYRCSVKKKLPTQRFLDWKEELLRWRPWDQRYCMFFAALWLQMIRSTNRSSWLWSCLHVWKSWYCTTKMPCGFRTQWLTKWCPLQKDTPNWTQLWHTITTRKEGGCLM